MYQSDILEVGDEANYYEDGAHWRVRLKSKVEKGKTMHLTFKVLEVFKAPFHGGVNPEVGSEINVCEVNGAGVNAGWSIDTHIGQRDTVIH
ncbi:hypothetical protein H0W91_00845 [Patescibacteria group bacterium]|nr:hypothetical protein [Patescibacteria group bacterium]